MVIRLTDNAVWGSLAVGLNLLLLAPDIQEQILFLSPTNRGRDPIRLVQLQPIARALDWKHQRRLWARLGSGVEPMRMGFPGSAR